MRCYTHGNWNCGVSDCHNWYRNQGYSFAGMNLAFDARTGGVDLIVGEVEIAPGIEIGYDVTTGEEVLEVGGIVIDDLW
jgi:hypothetical protein